MTPTIFHEDWWLNAATSGGYETVEVMDKGKTVGRLPYYRRRKFGIMWGALPPLTHFLGPAVDVGSGSITSRFNRRLEVTRELLGKLPPSHFTKIKCHHGIREVIAFQDMKFRTSVQFTYEIAPQPEDMLLKNMNQNTRRNLRSIEEGAVYVNDVDPAEYLAFYDRNLSEQGRRNHLDLAICKNLLTLSLDRGVGKFYAQRNMAGELIAGVFCVWDDVASYYLMTSRSSKAGSGAITWLIWEAIKDAAKRGLIFDFDGLGGGGSIQIYNGFGGSIEPRYTATRMSLPMTISHDIVRRLLNKEQYFY